MVRPFGYFYNFAPETLNIHSLEDTDSTSLIIGQGWIMAETIMNPFTMSIFWGLLIIAFLLFLSAFISGSEVAFFALNHSQIKDIRENRNPGNIRIITLLERPKRLLATILIANNLINVSIVILAVFIFRMWSNFSPSLEFIILAVAVTILILVFGEIVPKMYAAKHSIRFVRFMAPAMALLIRLFYPLSTILVKSTTLIDRRLAGRKPGFSISDLSDAIDITAGASTPEEEKKILKGIAKFGDIDVKEIMKSRLDVVAVEVNTPFSEMLDTVRESGYSRIPVYSDSFDNIVGILYVKDLLAHLDENPGFQWSKLIREVFFVPENKKIKDLLKEFQEKKIHMAVIVDEYGGTAGIVTLEDIIEEIVGDISDEFDTSEDEPDFKKIDDNNYVFEGKTTINDVCKIMGIDDDVFDAVKGEADSLAGLILELEGKIPSKDTVVQFRNFEFKILASDHRRIKRIKITIRT